MPVRMCAICRNRSEKENLLRIVFDNNSSCNVVIDKSQKLQGRGLYVCRECVDKIKKTKLIERSFKIKPDEKFFDNFISEAKNWIED